MRFFEMLDSCGRPDVVAFSVTILANVPEIVDLAKATKTRSPDTFVCVGGHSASFTAATLIEQGRERSTCVLKGEGEAGRCRSSSMPSKEGRDVTVVPGAITMAGRAATSCLSIHSMT